MREKLQQHNRMDDEGSYVEELKKNQEKIMFIVPYANLYWLLSVSFGNSISMFSNRVVGYARDIRNFSNIEMEYAVFVIYQSIIIETDPNTRSSMLH